MYSFELNIVCSNGKLQKEDTTSMSVLITVSRRHKYFGKAGLRVR